MKTSVFNFIYVLIFVCYCHAQQCGVYEYGVSQQEGQAIANIHNNFRNLIANGKISGQPRGKNFNTIKYDAALAQQAQNIANSCEFEHQTVKDGRWWWIGQNLYMSMSTDYQPGANWDAAIQSWINEHKIYKYGQGFSKQTGHYTQIIWAETEAIGCGYTMYEANDGYKYHKLYVCNYGPGGNFNGQLPYEKA